MSMGPVTEVPLPRIRVAVEQPVQTNGKYVLYWMTSQRRLERNFALDRAVLVAQQLGKPLLVFEPLRVGYAWASDRFHHFLIDGMSEHASRCSTSSAIYYPYVEPTAGASKGQLAALVAHACVVVTDDYPVFFLPHLLAAGERCCAKLSRRLEVVDGQGLLPMRIGAEKCMPTAYAFRRLMQRTVADHLAMPHPDPLSTLSIPADEQTKGAVGAIWQRWPPMSVKQLVSPDLSSLAIDHTVKPTLPGGAVAARARLSKFMASGLSAYGELRSEPDQDIASGLSPWLHFGHIGVHEIFLEVTKHENWTPAQAGGIKNGSRHGFWGMSSTAESFLDELITWRELGFHYAMHHPDDNDRYESLPAWARASLDKHSSDERPYGYTLEQLDNSQTHDVLWNAAQRQLKREGVMQNYLRMLWGKKILEWSSSPQQALGNLIHLNNRYALDGRDPNSYSGIFWCLGRFDRPWGPERPIFGVIRYMSSDNTAKKFSVKGYLARYGDGEQVSKPNKKSSHTKRQPSML
jgi:deoxyribodipyrimidine photo-lyase